MSDLQRAWAKSKLSQAHGQMSELEERDELDGRPDHHEAGEDDSSSASSVSSTGTIVPVPGQRLYARSEGSGQGHGPTLDAIPWTTFFERELFLAAEGEEGLTFHAYLSAPVDRGPLFVMHHGAGSSGLSFAALGKEIRKRLASAGILAVDCRAHGSTMATRMQEADLRLATLAADLDMVIKSTSQQMHWEELPGIVLVGHSLGGAVVTELAASEKLGGSLLGYAAVDIVEGAAMEALQHMRTFLATRPAGFVSVEAAIDWHVRSRALRNLTSARASVPALLIHDETADASRPWRWRTDLGVTEPFWKGWFAGLSKRFLNTKRGKLLLLAGTDRLDTELTIGQMQGKYALQVFTEAGHFIHEDLPEQTAACLVDFHKRIDKSALVLPPKVSELLRQGKKV